jgi:hypothetical protein
MEKQMSDNVVSIASRRDKHFLKKMTKEQRQEWMRKILKRMADAWQVEGKKGIAEIVGCHPKMPGNWIKDGSVPLSVIYTCHLDTGVSLDWLYNGVLSDIKDTEQTRKVITETVRTVFMLGVRTHLIEEKNTGGLNALTETLTDDFIKLFEQKHKL